MKTSHRSEADRSRLFIVAPQATPLRRSLQNSGYSVSLAGAELTWFEKTLVDDGLRSSARSGRSS